MFNTAFLGGIIHKFSPAGAVIGTYSHGAPNAQGCVVDRNDRHPFRGIVGVEQRGQRVADDRRLVVRRNQHGDRWPVGRTYIHEWMTLLPEEPVQCEHVLAQRIHAHSGHDAAEGDLESQKHDAHRPSRFPRRSGQLAPHA